MSRRRWDDEQKSTLRRQEAASAFIAAAVATVQRCAAAGAAGSWSIEPGAHVAIFEMRARGVSEGLLTEAESILDVLITGTRDDGFDAELAMRLLRRFADDVGCAHSPSPD